MCDFLLVSYVHLMHAITAELGFSSCLHTLKCISVVFSFGFIATFTCCVGLSMCGIVSIGNLHSHDKRHNPFNAETTRLFLIRLLELRDHLFYLKRVERRKEKHLSTALIQQAFPPPTFASWCEAQEMLFSHIQHKRLPSCHGFGGLCMYWTTWFVHLALLASGLSER